jgi:GlpG protein
MRIIGVFSDSAKAKKFNHFLHQQGIESHLELQGTDNYQVWVANEDQLQEAADLLRHFEQDPSDPYFDERVSPADSILKKSYPTRPARPWLTLIIMIFCASVYLLNLSQEYFSSRDVAARGAVITAVQSKLLYDFPLVREPVADRKGIELAEVEREPYWHGIYNWIMLKIHGEKPPLRLDLLFTQIRTGEAWRLFSPCVLHRDFFHILFNMIWLWILGRSVEQRIGIWRTLLLTIIAGVISNTAQYLVSGPFFMGYSGVIMGLAGFIWMRKKIAPWEGYPLARTTIWFLCFFVMTMFVLQIVSFMVSALSPLSFILPIANSAHIFGAATGIWLGRFCCFAWRIR